MGVLGTFDVVALSSAWPVGVDADEDADDVASSDVDEMEFSDVDDVLAYELAVVDVAALAAAFSIFVAVQVAALGSMYFDVCRFFSSVFCNTSIFSCKSFTSILDSFS